MSKKKKFLVKDLPNFIYENNMSGIYIEQDFLGNFFLEIDNIDLENKIISYDVSEIVAILMRVSDVKNNDNIWNIHISDDKDMSSHKALYWLSGGDKLWKSDKYYNVHWEDVKNLYNENFSNIIYDIIDDSLTFGDIRDGFKKKLNLQVFYEFALDNNYI